MPWWFQTLIVWLHVCGIVVWIGGLAYYMFVLAPCLRSMPITPALLQLYVRLDRAFRVVMWPAVGVVLLSGLFNLINRLYAASLAGQSLPTAFVALLSVKLGCVVLMLGLHGVQRFVLYPRVVTLLTRFTAAQIVPAADDFARLQRWSWGCHAGIVCLAGSAMWLGFLLRG